MTTTYLPASPMWCAGCGHFGVQAALVAALRELAIPPHEVLVLAGIGCAGTIQNNLGTYGYHALHGRVLPAATGVHLANPELTVIGAGGDGDGYAIGMGHLIHTFRRNPSFTYLVMNNGIYGLTKGQDSPTRGKRDGVVDPPPIDAVTLGLSIPSSTFIARGFVRWADQLTQLTVAALEHARAGRGLAFLEVLSPCVTYNDMYPSWEALLHDVDGDPGYDPADRSGAFRTAMGLSLEGRMAVGMIYRGESVVPAVHRSSPAHEGVDLPSHESQYRQIMDGYLV
jgi:2-oxoglutarate ferredoxin oxidoreductase subunit beta